MSDYNEQYLQTGVQSYEAGEIHDIDDEVENPLDNYPMPARVYFHGKHFKYIGHTNEGGEQIVDPDRYLQEVGIHDPKLLRLMFHDEFYDENGDVDSRAVRKIFRKDYSKQIVAETVEKLLHIGVIKYVTKDSDPKKVHGQYDFSPVLDQCQVFSEYDNLSEDALKDVFHERILKPRELFATDWHGFRDWIKDKSNHDVIAFRRAYVDMAGGMLNAGLVLSVLVYWHLPSKSYNPKTGRGKSHKMKVYKDGYYWVASTRKEWWERVRLSTSKVDSALAKLEELGLIIKSHYKFNGSRTIHVRINKQAFAKAWGDAVLNPLKESPSKSKKQKNC